MSEGGKILRTVIDHSHHTPDLDSLTSAFSLSYFLTHLPHNSLPLKHPLPQNARYAPLIQTNRTDAHLRPENIASVKAAGIDQEDILYLSDLTDAGLSLSGSDAFSPSHGTYLALVDHPQLELPWTTGETSTSERQVIIIVDHHADSGLHSDAALRVFREPEGSQDPNPTGSAQSVIIELFQKEIAAQVHQVPRSLADLAISTILIDTDNVSLSLSACEAIVSHSSLTIPTQCHSLQLRPAPKGRASKTDFTALDILLPLSSFSTSDTLTALHTTLLASSPEEVQQTVGSPDPEVSVASSSSPTSSIWSILSASKNAISHLSTMDLLKRDYKSSSLTFDTHTIKAGFSSVNLGLPEWLHRRSQVANTETSTQAWSEWWITLLEWMQNQNLDVAVVGTSFRDEKDRHARELVFALRNRRGVGQDEFSTVVKTLEADSTLDLIEPWKGARLLDTGKKERVSGIDKGTGLVQVQAAHAERQVWARVWRQGNDKANRKVYLPRIMAALQRAVKV